MILFNTHDFPPGGYAYREPSISFEVPAGSILAMQGLGDVAHALQTARANNPASGLNPDYSACLEAVKAFTCARLAGNPQLLAQFCREAVEAAPSTGPALKVAKRGCGSCGSRR